MRRPLHSPRIGMFIAVIALLMMGFGINRGEMSVVLEKAIHIYEQFGFYTIDCYNNSPMSTSIYMRLDL